MDNRCHNKENPSARPERSWQQCEISSVLSKDQALNEFEALNALRTYGIPFASAVIAADAAAAEAAVAAMPGPVVMKIVSRDIAHKADIGGVVTGVTRDTAAKTFGEIWNRVRAARPRAHLEGVLVQEQLSGIEVIVGAIRDAQFGHAIMFGLGGIWAETMGDATFRVPPLTREDSLAMIHGIRAEAILQGGRNQPAADIDALCNILETVGRLVVEFPQVAELDLNPIIATPTGATAVDAFLRVERFKLVNHGAKQRRQG